MAIQPLLPGGERQRRPKLVFVWRASSVAQAPYSYEPGSPLDFYFVSIGCGACQNVRATSKAHLARSFKPSRAVVPPLLRSPTHQARRHGATPLPDVGQQEFSTLLQVVHSGEIEP
jgi:hypothetical protein